MTLNLNKEFEKKAMKIAGKFFIIMASCFFVWACWFPFNKFASFALLVAIYVLILGIYLVESKSTRFCRCCFV